MSIKTWKEEFYPVEADSKEALKAPVAHSLRKWRGLTEKNLKKHGLYASSSGLCIKESGETVFEVIGDTCALCCYVNSQSKEELHDDPCSTCPLFRANKVRCDEDEEYESAYQSFLDHSDPAPMIKMLMKAKKKGYK